MTQPNLTKIVQEFRDLLQAEWVAANTSNDEPTIDKSDDLGKGRDLSIYDYVEVSETSPFGIEYADLFQSSQDLDATIFAEIKASDEDRRDELFSEFRRIVEANRSRPDTPGDFDRMVFADVTPLDDSTFGAYVYEVTIGFEARSRSVET
jgi:hypothetical protein